MTGRQKAIVEMSVTTEELIKLDRQFIAVKKRIANGSVPLEEVRKYLQGLLENRESVRSVRREITTDIYGHFLLPLVEQKRRLIEVFTHRGLTEADFVHVDLTVQAQSFGDLKFLFHTSGDLEQDLTWIMQDFEKLGFNVGTSIDISNVEFHPFCTVEHEPGVFVFSVDLDDKWIESPRDGLLVRVFPEAPTDRFALVSGLECLAALALQKQGLTRLLGGKGGPHYLDAVLVYKTSPSEQDYSVYFSYDAVDHEVNLRTYKPEARQENVFLP